MSSCPPLFAELCRILFGDRPYWWVHEHVHTDETAATAVNLQQYKLTCETGPGKTVYFVHISSYTKPVKHYRALQRN